MSVASEINRIKSNIAAAYTEAEAKGATMPLTENSANLADTVASIQSTPTPTLITKQIAANGTYSAEDDDADGYSEVTVNVPDASKTVLEGIIERSITTLASDVSSIGQYGFYYWTTLASVSFPNATSVGGGAFRNCTALTTVSMPNVSTLSAGAFRDCTSLVHVEFPNLTSLSTTVFNGCSNLTALILNQRATLAGGNSIPSQTIVYVENDDLEWYSSATNWAAIYADGRIRSIDELPPEGGTI